MATDREGEELVDWEAMWWRPASWDSREMSEKTQGPLTGRDACSGHRGWGAIIGSGVYSRFFKL